jgi:hypothetical protein
MDEVSSHVRLDQPFRLTARPLQRLLHLIADIGKILPPKFGFRNSRNAHELLSADFSADWNYQPTAHLELLLERVWNFWAASSDHNCIVRCVFWPALGAVGMQNVDVIVT